jgi:YegS/Rv2252/BmrU family lipid kinase
MKSLIIFNPSAGPRSLDDDLRQVAGYLESEGWEVVATRMTRGRADATTYAREAVAEGYDMVLAVGGDGTIAETIDGLIGTDTALAILPSGTGNVMARQLNLPIPGALQGGALLQGARLTLRGQPRLVDVGRMSFPAGNLPARHFVCWAGVGFDAEFNQQFNRDRDLKRRLGPGAMAVAMFYTLRDFAGTGAVVRVDGEIVSRRLLMLSASNIQIYGIIFKMAPRALLDDGLLDIICFQGSRPVRMIAHLGEMLFSQHVRDPQVDVFQAQRVEVLTSRPLPVHVDGDYIGETPVVIDVLPRALKLMVPSSASPGLFVEDSRDGAYQPGPTASFQRNTVARVRRIARDAQDAIKERRYHP